jgi:citrate synthase
MNTKTLDIKKGLEGVVVDSTSTSLVDGEAGRLYYRGYPIEKLMQRPFAAVAHLVVFGDLPDPAARLRRVSMGNRQTSGRPGNRVATACGAGRAPHGHPPGFDATDGH